MFQTCNSSQVPESTASHERDKLGLLNGIVLARDWVPSVLSADRKLHSANPNFRSAGHSPRTRVLSNSVTAIDSNGVAGNEVGRARGQVHGCSSNLLRLPPPPRRRACKNLVVHGRRADRGCHIGFNPPWCD